MVNQLIPDFEKYKRFSLLDQREVLLHSVMRRQCEKMEIDRSKKVSIITPTNKTLYMKNIFKNYTQQHYPNKELIIILNKNDLDKDDWLDYSYEYEDVKIYQLDEDITLGECINYAVERSSGDYIAKLDDDDYYGPNYLLDLINCFSYTNAMVVGKSSQFVYFESMQKLMLCHSGSGFRYTDVSGGTHVIKREVFDHIRFHHRNTAEDVYFNLECGERGFRHYAADPFNYLRVRRANKDFHTWKFEDDEYITWGILIKETDDPKPFVTV